MNRKNTIYELIKDDVLFGSRGRRITQDTYNLLPEESKSKFQEHKGPRLKSWNPGMMESTFELLFFWSKSTENPLHDKVDVSTISAAPFMLLNG